MNSDESNELLDLVNDHDEVIGTILRGEMAAANYRMNDGYVRFANGFVVNTHGLIWTQIRSPKKFIAPSGLDYSVAEHVLSGESYDEAIIRGFREELGWRIDPRKLVYLGVLPPTADKPVFDSFYVLLDYTGDNPPLNTDEFVSGEWCSIAKIRELVKTSPIAQKDSLLPALELLEQRSARTQ